MFRLVFSYTIDSKYILRGLTGTFVMKMEELFLSGIVSSIRFNGIKNNINSNVCIKISKNLVLSITI